MVKSSAVSRNFEKVIIISIFVKHLYCGGYFAAFSGDKRFAALSRKSLGRRRIDHVRVRPGARFLFFPEIFSEPAFKEKFSDQKSSFFIVLHAHMMSFYINRRFGIRGMGRVTFNQTV